MQGGVIYRDMVIRRDQIDRHDSSEDESFEDAEDAQGATHSASGQPIRVRDQAEAQEHHGASPSQTGADDEPANAGQHQRPIKHVLSVPANKLRAAIDPNVDFLPGIAGRASFDRALTGGSAQSVVDPKLNADSNYSYDRDAAQMMRTQPHDYIRMTDFVSE